MYGDDKNPKSKNYFVVLCLASDVEAVCFDF